jgi:hypothetical protein
VLYVVHSFTFLCLILSKQVPHPHSQPLQGLATLWNSDNDDEESVEGDDEPHLEQQRGMHTRASLVCTECGMLAEGRSSQASEGAEGVFEIEEACLSSVNV